MSCGLISPVAQSLTFPEPSELRTSSTLPVLGWDTRRSPFGVRLMKRALAIRAYTVAVQPAGRFRFRGTLYGAAFSPPGTSTVTGASGPRLRFAFAAADVRLGCPAPPGAADRCDAPHDAAANASASRAALTRIVLIHRPYLVAGRGPRADTERGDRVHSGRSFRLEHSSRPVTPPWALLPTPSTVELPVTPASRAAGSPGRPARGCR